MESKKLTTEQQDAADKLCDELGLIRARIEYVKRLSIDIQEGFFGKYMPWDALESLPEEDRKMFVLKLMLDYDSYRLYSEMLAEFASELECMINDLC